MTPSHDQASSNRFHSSVQHSSIPSSGSDVDTTLETNIYAEVDPLSVNPAYASNTNAEGMQSLPVDETTADVDSYDYI